MLPLLIVLILGILFMVAGSIGISALAGEDLQSLAPVGGLSLFLGLMCILLFALLSVPAGIVTAAAQAHVAARRSFSAAFEFGEWWQIFRQGLAQFAVAYLTILAGSFLFSILLQVAVVTIVLICILPLLMIPYSVYLLLVTNTLYAQAYATGRDALQAS